MGESIWLDVLFTKCVLKWEWVGDMNLIGLIYSHLSTEQISLPLDWICCLNIYAFHRTRHLNSSQPLYLVLNQESRNHSRHWGKTNYAQLMKRQLLRWCVSQFFQPILTLCDSYHIHWLILEINVLLMFLYVYLSILLRRSRFTASLSCLCG